VATQCIEDGDLYTLMLLAEEAFNFCSAQRLPEFHILIKPENTELFRKFGYTMKYLGIKEDADDEDDKKKEKWLKAYKRSPKFYRDVVRPFPTTVGGVFKN